MSTTRFALLLTRASVQLLADAAGVSNETVRQLLAPSRLPSGTTIARLAPRLGIKPGKLLDLLTEDLNERKGKSA